MDVIGVKLYSNHTKNLNHVHKDDKYLVYIIITVGKNISGVYTVFYDGVKTSDLGSRAHILKNLHGRMIFVPFENVFHEGTLCSGYRAVIYFILKKIILHLFRHGDRFYNRYINTADKKKNLDEDGSGVKQKISYKKE